MSESVAELKKLSDEELVERHDKQAQHTQVGIKFYLDELRGRENARLSRSVEKMTRAILWLTVIIGIATLVQLAIALHTMFSG